MKTLRYIGMAFIAVIFSVSFVACSDDKDDDSPSYGTNDLIGLWECVSCTGSDECKYKIITGDHIRFFDSEYKETDTPEDEPQKVFGKDCVVNLIGRSVDATLEEMMNMQEADQGCSHAYTVKGNILTIRESDLDTWVGTIQIDGDLVTFNYVYQNWYYVTETMEEEFGPFSATLKRIL